MKKIVILLSLFLCASAYAQENTETKEEKGFGFEVVKENPITPVKNQASSGTCWSYSGLGMIESELIRMGKGEHDLSDMFIVYYSYLGKARKYVRMHGETNFAAGGSFADVLECIRDYGIVPESDYAGLNYGEPSNKHGELDAILKGYVDAVIKNPNRKLSTAWFEGYTSVLNAYLGKTPETFTYQGKSYTPQSFAKELGIDADNYISITSYTHHPFYTAFPLEIPDNWRWSLSYNLPIEEMMQVLDNAIEKGYTVAWGSDVSEKGFNRKGIAVMPDEEATEGPGSDQAHWLGLSTEQRNKMISDLTEPVPEKTITQEMRQIAFDNYETTDDHGMQIYGTAKDKNGSKYYMVKNSWGTSSPYQGIWYASVPFVQYKTMNIVVHKDALPKDIKKKLNIN